MSTKAGELHRSYAQEMAVSAETLGLLTLLQLKGIGPQTAAAAVKDGSARALVERDASEGDRRTVAALVQECEAQGIGIVGRSDNWFPAQLASIPNSPAILYYRGEISIAIAPKSVAIVGTRTPTEWGVRATELIAERFAEERWTIVSGLALGIDTVAHRVALSHHAPTIAILGNGLGSVYPPNNASLADAIVASGGLLLAEVPPSTRASSRTLVARDRLQSGLATITVVCQGGRTSGAMHTARFATEQSRPLYVAALDRDSEELSEHDEGTQALLSQSPARLRDLLRSWKSVPARVLKSQAPPARPLGRDELKLLDLLEAASAEDSPRLC